MNKSISSLSLPRAVERPGWRAPVGSGVYLLTMPNVPRPLHGLPPRKIMGQTEWDKMRKRCYYNAGYKCEVCGAEPPKGKLHAHELYDIEYEKGTSTFRRCIAVCADCHNFIHSGRLVTLYKEGNPLVPKEYLLNVVEKGFALIRDHNLEFGDDLRAYATFLEYLKVPSLKEEMERLIKNYGMKFYCEPSKKMAKWGEWKLVWKGKEYPTPYANEAEWKEAMINYGRHDTVRAMKNDPFTGEAFNIINEILAKES